MIDTMAYLSSTSHRSKNAEYKVAQLLKVHGWTVQGTEVNSDNHYDLLIERDGTRYVVEVKAPTEQRADRVIPLLSQAILQAKAYTQDVANVRPLAVLYVEDASPSLLSAVFTFAAKFADGVDIGVVASNGHRYFRGEDFEHLNSEPQERLKRRTPFSAPSINLFSDLNQWLLKVLLAPDIPENLLKAPRNRYSSGAELAGAAQVSLMSVSRLLHQLRAEGYLDESARYLRLVRRRELFRLWGAASMRRPSELPMRFLIRADPHDQIQLLQSGPATSCLALFAAADVLNIGHVSGVAPYLYVPKLPQPDDRQWRALIAYPKEAPDLILLKAPFPESTFRGAVHRDGLIVSDVIQVYLDTAFHPARGAEQSDLIFEKFLTPVVDGIA